MLGGRLHLDARQHPAAIAAIAAIAAFTRARL